MVHLLRGRVLSPQGLFEASVTFDEHLQAITPLSSVNSDIYILPGFIDVHVHGGGGADTMDGFEGVRNLAAFHVQHGTTTLYPTTMTNPWENILTALKGVKGVMQEQDAELPDIPGVHLEGPFISPERLGAQPANTLLPAANYLEELFSLNVIKLVTIAPEIPTALSAAKQFIDEQIQLSIGHTKASYEQIVCFRDAVRKSGGKLGYTHLFNAMGGIEARKPGVAGAALADNESFAELIFDKQHVHEANFLMAFYAKQDKLLFVTDAMRATGMSEGKSELGGQEVIIKNGKAQLPNGNLAGSLLTLDQALRNAIEAGLTLEQASHLVSRNPAAYMGLSDRGSLELGKRADMVVLDQAFNVLEVYVQGKKVIG